jgi:hypothetical protein
LRNTAIFWTFIFFLMFSFQGVKAQEYSALDSIHTLRVQMPTTDYLIRINKTKILESINIVKLPAGVYQLEIWTPYHNFIDTTIIIDPNSKYTNLVLNFETNVDYLLYNKAVTAYEEQKLAKIGLPSVVVAASVGSALYFFYTAKTSRDLAQEAYTRWLGGNLNEKDNLMRNYKRYEADFNRQRVYNYLSWAVAGVGTYYLYKGIRWYTKNSGPEFRRKAAPFENLSMDYQQVQGQGVATFGLTFQLDKR